MPGYLDMTKGKPNQWLLKVVEAMEQKPHG
jgi:hypothetical protein